VNEDSVPEERPPERVLAAARAAYRVRRPDALLAELLSDSADGPAPGLRKVPGSGPRMLSFAAADSELHLHVTVRGDVFDLAGQFVPARRFSVELRHAEGVSRHASDRGGAFVVRFVPRGPVSLVCSPEEATGPALMVPWTVL